MKSRLYSIWPLVMLLFAFPVFAQVPDSVIIHSWELTDDYLKKERAPVDTLLAGFQVIHPALEKPDFPATTGNLGAPVISMDFLARARNREFIFLNHYLPYLNLGRNTRYYNTKRPFTQLQYSTAGSKVNQEQTLRVLHTQNIDPRFNAGISYNLISSNGQYTWQKTRLPLFRFFSSFERDKYNLHASLNINKMEVQENGGLVNDDDLGTAKPKDLAIRLPNALSNAQSMLHHTDVSLVQTYVVGQTGSTTLQTDSTANSKRKLKLAGIFSHLLEYEKSSRTYNDNNPGSGFYDTAYIDQTQTYDSAYFRSLRNTLQFEFLTDTTRKVSLLLRAGATHEWEHFANRMPTDTVITTRTVNGVPVNDTTLRELRTNDVQNIRMNFYVENALTRLFRWNAGGHVYLNGYKQGDLLLNGNMQFRFGKREPVFLLLLGSLENRKPQYFLNGYQSNHYIWSQSFGNITNTRWAGKLYSHERRFSLQGTYVLTDNYVYLDTAGIPRQQASPVSVLSADASKTFQFGKFRSRHRLLLQYSSNDAVIPLPGISYYQSTWFDYRIFFRSTGGTLYYQLGFDLWYHTAYYGPGYIPATGLFYNQREKKTGNYPYLDVFLNLKIKRTRFFLKFEHVHSGLMPARYFTVLHYPMNERMFKFGLAWTFYD